MILRLDLNKSTSIPGLEGKASDRTPEYEKQREVKMEEYKDKVGVPLLGLEIRTMAIRESVL